MKIKKKSLFILFVFLAGTFGHSAVDSEFSVEKAKRVEQTLMRLAKNKQRHSVFLKKVTFSEEELNAYLNLFYVKRYTPEVKYIKLKLDKKAQVEGIIKVKLAGKKYEKVPTFLRDIEVELSGTMECENYRMRFLFDKLKVNGTAFSPEVLDEAFSATQTNFKVKKSLYDWFQLLPGIKNVVVDYKKVTLFY